MSKNEKNDTFTNILYYIAMAVLALWFAYSKGWILANFQSVDAKTAIEMLNKDNNVSLLDVRTIQEYKEGHLQDATLIPVEHLEENLGMLKDVKQKKILLYCQSGNRSVYASRLLEKHGFTPVNIKGGIIELKHSGADILK